MSDLGFKVISARVPFEFYMKHLTMAQEWRMNISDYIVYRLEQSTPNKEEIESLKEEIESTQDSHASLYSENKSLSQDLRNEKNEYRTLAYEFKRIKEELEEQKRINNLGDLLRG